MGAIYPLQPQLGGMTAKNLKQNHQGCYFLNYNLLSQEEPASGIRFVKYVGKLEKYLQWKKNVKMFYRGE